jgi:hypothetical protein
MLTSGRVSTGLQNPTECAVVTARLVVLLPSGPAGRLLPRRILFWRLLISALSIVWLHGVLFRAFLSHGMPEPGGAHMYATPYAKVAGVLLIEVIDAEL